MEILQHGTISSSHCPKSHIQGHLPQPKIRINHEFCNPQSLSAPRGDSCHDFLPVMLKHTQFKVPTPVVPEPDQSVRNLFELQLLPIQKRSHSPTPCGDMIICISESSLLSSLSKLQRVYAAASTSIYYEFDADDLSHQVRTST